MFRLAAIVVICIVAAQATPKLPKWVTPCYRDADFDACALKNGNAAMANLVKGDRKLRLPVLDPLIIPVMDIDHAATSLGLDVNMRNVHVIGLQDALLDYIHIDFDKRFLNFTAVVPHIQFVMDYTIKGRILVLPVTGAGPGNVTLANVRVSYYSNFDLPLRNGLEYIKLRDSKLSFTTTRAHITMENLFNGDKVLGTQMNLFMNENWNLLVDEISPAVSAALGQVMTQILSLLADQVPYKDIVLVKPT